MSPCATGVASQLCGKKLYMKKAVPQGGTASFHTEVTRPLWSSAFRAAAARGRCRLRLLLLLEFLCLVAELVGLLQERLLLGGIFLHQRLRPEEEILVGQRLEVVRLEGKRLVGL